MAYANDAGYWGITLRGIPVGGARKVQSFNALMSLLEGGTRSVCGPVYDREQAPWPSAGGWEANAQAADLYDDGLGHDDGFGHFEPAIRVTLNGAHANRATTIDVTIGTAGTIY